MPESWRIGAGVIRYERHFVEPAGLSQPRFARLAEIQPVRVAQASRLLVLASRQNGLPLMVRWERGGRDEGSRPSQKSSCRRDAGTNRRDACATRRRNADHASVISIFPP